VLLKEGDIYLGRIYAIDYRKNRDDKKGNHKRIFAQSMHRSYVF